MGILHQTSWTGREMGAWAFEKLNDLAQFLENDVHRRLITETDPNEREKMIKFLDYLKHRKQTS